MDQEGVLTVRPVEQSVDIAPTPKKLIPASGHEYSMCVTPERKFVPAPSNSVNDALRRLRQAAASYKNTPSIFLHTSPEEEHELQQQCLQGFIHLHVLNLPLNSLRDKTDLQSLEQQVPAWEEIYRDRPNGARRDLKFALRAGMHTDPLTRHGVQKVSKSSKSKGLSTGRTYTSKYRGVHQTFPTKRWEAQFRRNGKPTSLGCFDEEAEAAKAYDKMMVWCELNTHGPVKAGTGVTNFDVSEYEKDIPYLSTITQDVLTQALRQDGRNQAAKRTMRQKREGQLGVTQLNAAFEQVRDGSQDEGQEHTMETKSSGN